MLVRGTKVLSRVTHVNVRAASTAAATKKEAPPSWRSLVSPWSPPEFVQRMKAQETAINSMESDMSGAKLEAVDIDWAHWKKNIKTKGVVDEVKKAFDAHQFEDFSVAHLEPEFKAQAEEAQKARRKAVWATRELERTKYCQGIQQQVAKDMYEWNQWQWMDAIPGCEEQVVEQYKEEDWIASERQENLVSYDFEALGNAWKKGVAADPPAPCDRIGDIYPAEEMKLQDEGVWSIKRLYLFKEERNKLQDQLAQEKQELDRQFPL
jgi:hypothetical protein